MYLYLHVYVFVCHYSLWIRRLSLTTHQLFLVRLQLGLRVHPTNNPARSVVVAYSWPTETSSATHKAFLFKK